MKRIACLLFLCLSLSLVAQRELWPMNSDKQISNTASDLEPVLWQIPVGSSLIETMELVSGDELLVALKDDNANVTNGDVLLIDTNSGEVRWRYERGKGNYQFMGQLEDVLLFQITDPRTTEFIAIKLQTGEQVWSKSFKNWKVWFLPVLPGNQIWAYGRRPDKMTIESFDVSSGELVWEAEAAGSGSEYLLPEVFDDRVIEFFDGVRARSINTGEVLFDLPEMSLNASSAPPWVDNEDIWLITRTNRLACVSIETGERKMSFPLASGISFTNITGSDDRIYLRAETRNRRYQLLCYDRKKEALIWTHELSTPSVSNVLEVGQEVYYANASTIFALQQEDGAEIVRYEVTKSGRNYPVVLRELEGIIVYIGELVLAAYNHQTGHTVYKNGITPLGASFHLNGLDVAIPNLKQQLGEIHGQPHLGLSSFASDEARMYQNMANRLYSDYKYYLAIGKKIKSDLKFVKYLINNKSARTQSTIAMSTSMMELGMAIGNTLQVSRIKGDLNEQKLNRKAILDLYQKSDFMEYICRPNLVSRGSLNDYVAVRTMHVATGKTKETILSPQYSKYGFWNLVDIENKRVYHHGIGMDPSQYQLQKANGGIKSLGTFLIAAPLRVPD